MAKFGPLYWKSFRAWLKEPLGQTFLKAEAKELQSMVNTLYGYHLLLLGDVAFGNSVKSCPILHRVWIHPHVEESAEFSPLASRQDKLPVLSDEVELVYLAHALEFLKNPHEALREAYRVLKPEGHVVISCFNPWSIWGVWRSLLHFIKRVPWDGRFISLYRLKDWLALLGFDVIETRRCFFRPPVKQESWLKNLAFLETIGAWCWPIWGANYIILAKKRVMTLTPVRRSFKLKRRELQPGLIEPAANKRHPL